MPRAVSLLEGLFPVWVLPDRDYSSQGQHGVPY